ncbi:MAG TPA: carboxypeptidase regulatory-like domain-containing protein [Gemmatimonadaceae bacterium]|jgi:hypothetical protein
MRRVLSLVVFLTILMASRASAQQMRGVVHDSAAGAPLAGAVVTALDSAGRNGARTISGSDGRFAIIIGPSTTRLRVLRIGYRPIDMVLRADRTTSIGIRMGHVPPILDVVRVSGSELCPGSPERGAAFQIWEQARAGLLATIVGREANPAMATTVKYSTHLAPNSLLVREQTKTVLTGQTSRPFVASAKPSFFAALGYMLEDGGTRFYNAPDADVLIDESFAATHCFRLRHADSAHPGQVGLAFSPVDGRDTLVDVDGVIWVDATTPQLRSLEFVYTSLEPAATDAKTGGFVNFRTMSNGVSFIDRWNLRLASLMPPANGPIHNMHSVTKPRRTDLAELKVRELIDAGGLVLNASWPDGTRFSTARSFVSGVVVGKGTGTPAVGAIVDLAGTSDTVKTDSTGHFRIETLPGKYVIEVRDTTLSAYIAPRFQTTPVELREGAEATARLEVTPIERALGDVCHGQPMPPKSAIVIGYVALTAGELPHDVSVEANFQHISDAEFSNVRQTITVDDRGRFFVCGTPKDRNVHLRLKASGVIVADTSVIVQETEFIHKVLWLVSRP